MLLQGFRPVLQDGSLHCRIFLARPVSGLERHPPPSSAAAQTLARPPGRTVVPEAGAEPASGRWIGESRYRGSTAIPPGTSCHWPGSHWSCSVSSWHCSPSFLKKISVSAVCWRDGRRDAHRVVHPCIGLSSFFAGWNRRGRYRREKRPLLFFPSASGSQAWRIPHG